MVTPIISHDTIWLWPLAWPGVAMVTSLTQFKISLLDNVAQRLDNTKLAGHGHWCVGIGNLLVELRPFLTTAFCDDSRPSWES